MGVQYNGDGDAWRNLGKSGNYRRMCKFWNALLLISFLLRLGRSCLHALPTDVVPFLQRSSSTSTWTMTVSTSSRWEWMQSMSSEIALKSFEARLPSNVSTRMEMVNCRWKSLSDKMQLSKSCIIHASVACSCSETFAETTFACFALNFLPSTRVRTVKQELSSVLKNLNGDGSGLSDDECGELLSRNWSTVRVWKPNKNELRKSGTLLKSLQRLCYKVC